ncbi:helix-turn-helix transcriptional regulator [Nocardioides albidus]|nr:helix-turn-helix transcriptional regulator [Nocardioides albidus]
MVRPRSEVPLVGRERELELLRAVVAAAADGRPGAVLVAGPAGVGKSRVVRSLQDGLREGRVVRVQCVDLGEPGLPLLALTDLARALGDEALLTELADSAPDEARRLRTYDAMATRLAAAGRAHGPVAVVVEDLQWMDASSADFLRFLLTRAATERIAVVATLRTDGLAARPRIRRLVGELGRLEPVRRVDLAPLAPDEVRTLLGHVGGVEPEPHVADEVFRRTAGNPFFVQALAEELAETGRLDAVPTALADLLVGRLEPLDETARAVVRTASGSAGPVPDAVLRVVVGRPDAEVDEALRAAVQAGLLTAEGDGYAFAHDLLRAAIHDDLLPGVRLRLHARYAAALAAAGASPGEVARHHVLAGNRPEALAWSLRAADDALSATAPDAALQHLQYVLDTWSEVDEADALSGTTRGRVAVRAAVAAGLAGEPARSVDLARLAVDLADAVGDATGAVQARAELVRQLIALDRTEELQVPAEQAVALAAAEDVDAGTAALAEVMLARSLLSSRRTDAARPVAERALHRARAAAVPRLEVDALTTVAFLDEIGGDPSRAADQLGAAVLLAREHGELAAELRAHYTLASLHYYGGDVAGARPVLRTALARAEETGLRWSDPGVEMRVLEAIALYVGGDLDASLAAAAVPDQRRPDTAAARLAAVGCYAAVARGRDDAALRLDRLADSWDVDPQVALVAGGCETERLTWAGEPSAAAAVAGRALAHLDAVVGDRMYGGLWLAALALGALADEAAACRLRRDGAGAAAAEAAGAAWTERAEQLVARGRGRPGDLGPEGRAWHARTVAEAARLRGEPAVEEWEAALAAFGYGHEPELARCRWRLAEARLVGGDRESAAPLLAAAAESAARMGARPLQDAICATQRRTALDRPARGTTSVLTGREREVLGLVAEGLTNREIGRRLHISEKTASVHLSNVMAKLGASSRTEAVTVAHRRGLIEI